MPSDLVMTTHVLLLQAGGLGGLLSGILPFLLIFLVFYFLIIRPQQTRQRALQELIANVKAGDRIVTTGGVVATITAVRDTTLLVRTADKSMLEITRAAVAGLQNEADKK